MQSVDLTDLFKGAVSVEETPEYMRPWRVPFKQAHLFVPNAINGKAEIPAGVRITFESDTTTIKIGVIADEVVLDFDVFVDGAFHQHVKVSARETEFVVHALESKNKHIDIYLSQKHPVSLTGVWIDDQAQWSPVSSQQKRWITYGSSITQCVDAESPAYTWPALVSRELNLDLTCLGFSANCHMEPMLSRMIRDLPADFISLCVGINIMGGSTLSKRTFAASLIGFIQTIREKHPTTPMAIMSPVYCKEREEKENKVGLNLVIMREEIEKVVQLLRTHGDKHIHYINGLDVFGEAYADYYPDGLHPNAEGYKVMGENMGRKVKEVFSGYDFLDV